MTSTAPSKLKAALDWASHKARRVVEFGAFLYVRHVPGFTVPDTPDFDPVSLPYFLERLASAKCYLEFGSGASTVLAARQGVPFTTVESDSRFLDAVRRKIAAAGALDPNTQRFLHVDLGVTEAWGAPLLKTPNPARVARWRHYPDAPWVAAAPTPDLILVDGRFRAACALTAIQRLGAKRDWELLVDDYVEREDYRIVERFAVLERFVGRMAVFKPRDTLDAGALAAAIETARAQWR